MKEKKDSSLDKIKIENAIISRILEEIKEEETHEEVLEAHVKTMHTKSGGRGHSKTTAHGKSSRY